MHWGGSVNGPLIIAISVGGFLVLLVAVVWIVRWARRKPSTQLPPPRLTTTYWADDEESKYSSYHSGPTTMPRLYGPGEATDSSQVSLWRGPDGEYYTTTNDFRADETGSWVEIKRHGGSSGMPSPVFASSPSLQPSPNGAHLSSASASSSSSALYPRPSMGRDASSSSSIDAGSTGGPDHNGKPFSASPSEEYSRPPTSSTSTEPINPSFNQYVPRRHSQLSMSTHAAHVRPNQATTVDRRQSRHSLYSLSTRSLDPNPRRASVRGAPPHKSNMLIVLPEPLAAAPHTVDSPVDGFTRSQSQRRSRADLWTETNRRNSYASLQQLDRDPAPAPGATRPPMRRRRSSQGSERSIELANSHFVHPEPPPPLPTTPSLTSRVGTPASAPSIPLPDVPDVPNVV